MKQFRFEVPLQRPDKQARSCERPRALVDRGACDVEVQVCLWQAERCVRAVPNSGGSIVPKALGPERGRAPRPGEGVRRLRAKADVDRQRPVAGGQPQLRQAAGLLSGEQHRLRKGLRGELRPVPPLRPEPRVAAELWAHVVHVHGARHERPQALVDGVPVLPQRDLGAMQDLLRIVIVQSARKQFGILQRLLVRLPVEAEGAQLLPLEEVTRPELAGAPP
mmetsp:Transcript_35563/g.84272  ORF Transcript_35563/g.84272 Transcript_35563/m.84272 type:complete len:221 (+) Transcript_35563:1144-1806(+)